MYKNFTRFFCKPPGYIHKFLLIMKLIVVLLTVGLLQVSAAGLAQKVTFVKKNATLKQVFTEVYKQTGYSVFWTSLKSKSKQIVNANFKNASIKEVLEKTFENQPVVYTIEDKIIVIRDADKILSPVAVTTAKDTAMTITGRVINEDGQPLNGATVQLINTNKVSVSLTADENGRFRLSGEKGSRLTINYVGFETISFTIKKGSLGDIKLLTRYGKLDEVKVTIGYGTTTKALNTGNVAVVTSDEISKQPVSNVLQALQGAVPGLIINQASGFASAPFNVKIRGQNSLNNNGNSINNLSEPLFIIDGVPIVSAGSSSNLNVGINKNGLTGPSVGQSPLYGLNPTDIESISVLKDADATAIYGARGANGVILITTKKGKAGPTTVTANVYTGQSLQTRKLDLMNTQEYLAMRTQALQNDKITPTAGNAYDLLKFDQNRYTDWQKELLATGHTTDAQLSLSGGDSKTTYRLSGGFNSLSPPFKGNYKEQRASASLALTNSSFNNKLTTTATVNFSSTVSNLPPVDITSLIFLAPNAPSLLDDQGNLNYTGWAAAGASLPNSAINLKRLYSANTKNLIGNLGLKYHILNGLDFNASLGYNITRQDQLQTAPTGSFNPTSTTKPFASFGTNNNRLWVIEPNLTYTKAIGKHNLSLLAGSTFQDTQIDGNNISASGYSSDALLGALSGASAYSVVSNYADTKFESLYARINYNYDDKYVLNLNGRRDGSSRFANGNKFGNFGSIGAAWIFSREPFLQNVLKFLSFGKLRASYGLVGGDNLSDYQYLSSFSPASNTYQNTTAYKLNRLANDTFSWTTNKKLEAALALGFFDGRINAELAWYQNRAGNQLVSYPLPSLTGFVSVIENLPAVVENKGLEFTLQTQNIRTKGFSWGTNFNIAQNRNKLISFPGLASSTYAGRYAIGRSINTVGMYQYTGVNPTTGAYTFADVNGNGTVDTFGSTDYIYKDSSPLYTGAMNNNFSYKGFQLGVFFTFTKQKGVLRLSNVTPGGLGSGIGNQLILSEQLAGKPALDNLTTSSFRADLANYYNSDAVFVDASYIRLQNLSFAYNLPLQIVHRAKLQNFKIYTECQNLLTITGYKGTDPASPGSFTLPPRKIVTAGIQITL